MAETAYHKRADQILARSGKPGSASSTMRAQARQTPAPPARRGCDLGIDLLRMAADAGLQAIAQAATPSSSPMRKSGAGVFHAIMSR